MTVSSEFLVTALIVALVPGTGVIYTVSNGLFGSRRTGALAALGCTLGIVPHLVAATSVFAKERFDRVISLCDRLREVCPEFPGRPETAHWSIPDPTAGHADGDDEASYPDFQQTADELETRIGFLLAALTAPTTPP